MSFNNINYLHNSLLIAELLYSSIFERYSNLMGDNKIDKTSEFKILRNINSKPEINQRLLAIKLGFSLGKLNYCLKALKKKGLIKFENFNKSPNKLKYTYLLTPKGIKYKSKMASFFYKQISQEYEDLKKELKENEKNR